MAESPDRNLQTESQLQAGVELPAERKFYFNGFAVAISPPDVRVVLLQDEQPIALLHTSHVMARTLAVKLNDLIKRYEEGTGQHVSTLDEIKATVSGEE